MSQNFFFCFILLLRSSLTVSQSERSGVHVDLLLSSSLAHASQAAAARISKENSGLFKQPMQARTHTLHASEVKESGAVWITHISPHDLLHTIHTHFKALGHICGHPLTNRDIAEFCWVVKSDIGLVDWKKLRDFVASVCDFIIPMRVKPIPSILRRSHQKAVNSFGSPAESNSC